MIATSVYSILSLPSTSELSPARQFSHLFTVFFATAVSRTKTAKPWEDVVRAYSANRHWNGPSSVEQSRRSSMRLHPVDATKRVKYAPCCAMPCQAEPNQNRSNTPPGYDTSSSTRLDAKTSRDRVRQLRSTARAIDESRACESRARVSDQRADRVKPSVSLVPLACPRLFSNRDHLSC